MAANPQDIDPRTGYRKETGLTVAFSRHQLQWYFLTPRGTPLRISSSPTENWLDYIKPIIAEAILSSRLSLHAREEIWSALWDIRVDGQWHPIDRWALLNILADHAVTFRIYQTPTEARDAYAHTQKKEH